MIFVRPNRYFIADLFLTGMLALALDISFARGGGGQRPFLGRRAFGEVMAGWPVAALLQWDMDTSSSESVRTALEKHSTNLSSVVIYSRTSNLEVPLWLLKI
jgi:hypothetical protein